MKQKTKAGSLDKQIGAKLKTMRLARGHSQQTLGEKIGVTFQQLQKYEAGTNRISLATAAHIADVLGVSVLDLFPASDKRRKVQNFVTQKTLVKIARLNSAIGKVLKDAGI